MSMVLPGVVGFKLLGKLRDGVTATDLVLIVTQMLRKHGIVGKFVHFYGKYIAENKLLLYFFSYSLLVYVVYLFSLTIITVIIVVVVVVVVVVVMYSGCRE